MDRRAGRVRAGSNLSKDGDSGGSRHRRMDGCPLPCQRSTRAWQPGPLLPEGETMAAETKSVYLSSTLLDMVDTRAHVSEYFTRNGWPVKHSYETDPREGTIESCLTDVRNSDVYVGLVGLCYGTEVALTEGGPIKSITEHEFDAAVESGRECHVFLHRIEASRPGNHVDLNQGKVRAFRQRIADHCRPTEYLDHAELTLKLLNVTRSGSSSSTREAGDHTHSFRLPPLPNPAPERAQAINLAAASVFDHLADSVPNAAQALKARCQSNATRDQHTAAWALNNLTSGLESAPVIRLVQALSTPDHSQFSAAVKLLMRLYVCRGFSGDGWQRLQGLRGGGLLQINDLWLLHAGAQAAVGLDFDLPDLSPGPHPAAPSNRYLHELVPGLCAGLGVDTERQIEGEMVRQFPDFTQPRPSAEAGIDALLDWRADLAAHVQNRGQIDNRNYAVAKQVADEATAAELASAVRAFGVLPLAYAKTREDAYLDESFRVLLSALKLCQTALHKLTPTPTPQP